MATFKGIAKVIGDLSIGFQVGPFQTSIPLGSASSIVVLAAGKHGWWKTKDRVNCLQWLTQSEGSLLVAACTFDNAAYEERRTQYAFRGVTVQADEENNGRRFTPLTVGRANTCCYGSPGVQCLRALTSALLCLFRVVDARDILVTIMPKYLLHFDSGADYSEDQRIQALPAILLAYVSSVNEEEDFDDYRESLLRRLDQLQSRVTDASREDLRDCYFFELEQATAFISWALTPLHERTSEAYEVSHPNVFPFVYPTRSLRVWALAFILGEIGFQVIAHDTPIQNIEQYDSVVTESQDDYQSKAILVLHPLGRREDTSLNPRGRRAPVTIKRRIRIRNIPSLVFEQYGLFGENDSSHLNMNELEAIFQSTFNYVSSKLPEYQCIQKFARTHSDVELRIETRCPEHEDKELSSYQMCRFEDWQLDRRILDLLAVPIRDNIPESCPDNCGPSKCNRPPPELEWNGTSTAQSSAAHAWKDEVRSNHSDETPWIRMHMIMLGFAYATICQFLRVDGGKIANHDTEVILSPISFYETVSPDEISWGKSRLLIPDGNTLEWVRTLSDVIGFGQGISVSPHKNENMPARLKRVLYHMVCGVRAPDKFPGQFSLGCCANGLTLMSQIIVKLEVDVAALYIHHVEFGRILDLPVGSDKIIAGCSPASQVLLQKELPLAKLSGTTWTPKSTGTLPGIRWDPEPDWQGDANLVAISCRVDNIPRLSRNPLFLLNSALSDTGLLERIHCCKFSQEHQTPVELPSDEFWMELDLKKFYRGGAVKRTSGGIAPEHQGSQGGKWYIVTRAGTRSQDQLVALQVFSAKMPKSALNHESKNGAYITRKILSPCFHCAVKAAREDPPLVKDILKRRLKIDKHIVFIVISSY
jgi:hypothetical protein